MRPLRIERYGDRPSLPADVALCAAVVRLAMRDALRGNGEASDFLATFLDGVRADLLSAYHTGAVDLTYLCPWERPELPNREKSYR